MKRKAKNQWITRLFALPPGKMLFVFAKWFSRHRIASPISERTAKERAIIMAWYLEMNQPGVGGAKPAALIKALQVRLVVNVDPLDPPFAGCFDRADH